VPDADLRAAIRNLGGHDLRALDDAFRAIDDTRPVIFALRGSRRRIVSSISAARPFASRRRYRRPGVPY
jgi:hypothetical protein